MLIALIDDGINTAFYPGAKVKMDLSVGPGCEVTGRDPGEPILTDHGTTCAMIISKYAPCAEFCSLRIFHDTDLKASADQLASALDWCLGQDAPIVHLSVGTSLINDYAAIRPIIARMIQKGQVVVAAYRNRGAYSIPASLAGVFGVLADRSMRDGEYKAIIEPQTSPYFLASSSHKLSDPVQGPRITQIANSYAAPTVTAALHNILMSHPPFSLSVPRIYRTITGKDDALCWSRPDFIEDAYVINASGQAVSSKHFFFRCIGMLTDFSDFLSLKSPWRSLVYLPPGNSSTPICSPELFKNISGSMLCSLPCGAALLDSPGSELRDGMMWREGACISPHHNEVSSTQPTAFDDAPPSRLDSNEAVCRQHGPSEPSPEEGTDDCPLIYIYGRGMEVIDAICRLRDLFCDDNYQCCVISCIPFAWLYGFHHGLGASSLSTDVDHVREVYEPDVILLHFRDECNDASHLTIDTEQFHIIIGSGGFSSGYEQTRADNIAYAPADIDEASTRSLYARIIDYYS